MCRCEISKYIRDNDRKPISINHVLQGGLKARTIELDEGHKSYQMKTNDKQTNSNRRTSCMPKVEITEDRND